jgi:hypothetical protein
VADSRTAEQIPQVNQEQGESTMSDLDTLTEQFERLLEGISTEYTLEEWRYAYREIIYAGAMKILEEFPEIVVGPAPSTPPQQQQQQQQGPGFHPAAPGQRPPYYPSSIFHLVCIALGNCPPPT